MDILSQILQTGFLAATIRLAAPLLLGAMGELFAERAGVLNLGIEGIMLASAFAGFMTVHAGGDLWLGVLAAAVTGLALGAVMGVLCVTLALDQTVAGLGLTMTATGLVYFIYRVVFAGSATPPAIEPFATLPLPLLSAIPVLGTALFNQYALTYIAILLVPAAAFYLRHTPGGLALRTVGENPQAAAAAGISVAWTRYRALMISGALIGLAGAYLNLAAFGSFTFGIVSGRGWICVALVVLGRWKPLSCAAAALLFGGVDALQLRLQSSGAIDLPYQVFLMLPFLATLIAMAVAARNAHAPAALMLPFRKEER